MSESNFRQLVENYITGQITEPDRRLFFNLLAQEDYQKIFEQILHEEWHEGKYEEQDNSQVAKLIEQFVVNRINEKKPVPIRSISFPRRYRIAAAAIFILAIAGIIWVLSKDERSNNNIVNTNQKQNIDIGPGTNGAILTLDNGKQIILDSTNNGLIARQGNSNIVKKGQELSYQSTANTPANIFNTITTPKGRQYPHLVLADGSKVWLDAGSSIRFPVAFTGGERKVEITGQVWFDVSHNDKMPFKVIAKGVEITDLGTEFNVNAYDDEEKLKITLLQGGIKIQSRILKPGQQAQIPTDGKMQIASNVDVDQVMAWKNGFFSFQQTDIKGIMRQLSRWYDLEVRYEGINPTETFTGEIDRNLSLSEVLKILQKTNVHFRIEEGRKLIILP